jgi:hypothetical protein
MNSKPREFTLHQPRLITAPLPEVWRLHADVEAWPTWNSSVLDVAADGPLAAHSTFTTTTSDGAWQVRVYALTEDLLTFWGNLAADGSCWLQTWSFEDTAKGTYVAATTSVLGSTANAAAAQANSLCAATDGQLNCLQLCAELHAARGA